MVPVLATLGGTSPHQAEVGMGEKFKEHKPSPMQATFGFELEEKVRVSGRS
jgi:hypothetical protein